MYPILTFGVATVVACLSGCALSKSYIDIGYVPQQNVVRAAGAESVVVGVAVSDVRAVKDKVSAKKNGFGMEMAAIIPKEDVAGVVKSAIEMELTNRGFQLGQGGVSTAVELSKFYSDFKVGFWSGDAVGEVTMSVQVRRSDGTIVYSKLVTGQGAKDNLQLASGKNAKVALDGALRDAIAKLFSDAAFVQALLQAATVGS